MLKSYLKIAWRNLTRKKFFTLINICGLALGTTACIVIFILASFELSFDTFHPRKERIFRVVGSMNLNGTQNDHGYVPAPLPDRLNQQISGLERSAGFYNYHAKITVPRQGADPLTFDMPGYETASPVIIAQPEYFSIFQYTWLAGHADPAPFKVVISEKEIHRFFGPITPQQAIGKEIIYNDSLHVTVSGVVRSWEGNTDLAFSHFISYATLKQSFLKDEFGLNNWGTWDARAQAFVVLNKHVKPEQVTAQFPAFIKANFHKGDVEKVQLKLQPLTDIHFNATYPDAYSRKAHLPTLYVLMGIAAFILIIAAINYINLSIAQSVERSKEVGIRKVLGTNKTRLILQFLSETAVITFAAILVSIGLLRPAFSMFQDYLPANMPLQLLSPVTLLFFLGILIVTTLLAGLYPAHLLSSGQPVLSLKGRTPADGGKGYLRKGLIIFQFTISLVFIIGAIGVGKQIHYLLNKEMGFNKDAVINISIPAEHNDLNTKKVFTQKVRQLSGIAGASLHRETPAANRHGNTSIKQFASGATEITAAFEYCDENYLPLYDIKILEGRNIHPSDTLKEFLINAVCAKELGFADPRDAVGKLVQVGISGKTGPIVGVINDFHAKSLHETIQSFFITTNVKGSRNISVKLLTAGKQTHDFRRALANIEAIWHQLYPDTPFKFSFFDQTIASFYEAEQKTARLINIAMSIAIFISCIGLYGITAYVIRQRRREIGIRKVLGASTHGIIMMLYKDFLNPVLIAILAASPIAWYCMHQWLENFPYRTHINWVVYAAAGLCAILIAIFTVSFQAMKVATANPVKSLRTD